MNSPAKILNHLLPKAAAAVAKHNVAGPQAAQLLRRAIDQALNQHASHRQVLGLFDNLIKSVPVSEQMPVNQIASVIGQSVPSGSDAPSEQAPADKQTKQASSWNIEGEDEDGFSMRMDSLDGEQLLFNLDSSIYNKLSDEKYEKYRGAQAVEVVDKFVNAYLDKLADAGHIHDGNEGPMALNRLLRQHMVRPNDSPARIWKILVQSLAKLSEPVKHDRSVRM